MRITNTTSNDISLSDIDRGNVAQTQIASNESWNAKQDTKVPANGTLDVFDTDKVMMSTEMGQIKTFKDAGTFTTEYSIVGRGYEPFEITGSTNTFNVAIGTDPAQSFTLPTGTAITTSAIVGAINGAATGFTAVESTRFFRASNTDDVLGEFDSDHKGLSVRGPSIMSGFVVLYGADKITIGNGNANAVLGFTEGMYTQVK